MSRVQENIDLGALARPEPSIPEPRRGWLAIVFPTAIVAIFLFLLRDALFELVRERVPVTLIRPERLEGSLPSPTRVARVSVQAAGWVEADPFPELVPALAGGVVAEILVQESDVVRAGDTVARIVADDARLAAEVARALLVHSEAELEPLRARARIARERFDAAIEVTEAARSARAIHDRRQAEAELRSAAIAQGQAEVELAESELIVQRELDQAGASGARQVEIAVARVEMARAKLAGLQADLTRVQADLAEASSIDELRRRELELRFDDRRERDVSAAEVAVGESKVSHHRAALAVAELELTRMNVVAAHDGVVLERIVAAGQVLAPGQAVCALYDPERLRVRVDVPQGDVERLFVGQRAEILSESRAGRPYEGEVLRIVQRADIQKVTLEAQVRVLNADGLLRPDMLTQVRFLGSSSEEISGDSNSSERAKSPDHGGRSAGLRVSIPERLVRDGQVWVLDPEGHTATQRAVEVRSMNDGRLEVLKGLNLTDKVIDTGRRQLAAKDGAPVGVPVRVVGDQEGTDG